MKSAPYLLALICVSLSPMLAMGAAELQYQGYTLITSGQYAGSYDHVYNLVNTTAQPTVDIYDIDFDYSYAAAWLNVYSDNPYWTMAPWQGPLHPWQTDTAPCTLSYEVNGLHIYAATPVVGPYTATVTTNSQHTLDGSYTITAQLPTPEPASLVLLAIGGLALLRRRA